MEHQVLSAESRVHTWLEVSRAFIGAEVRGLIASVLQPLWKVGLAVAIPVMLVLTYFALFRRLVVPEHDPSLALTLLVLLGFSVFYGVTIGAIAGLINAGRRLVGNKFLAALPVIGLCILMTVSLFLGWIQDEGKATVTALATSADNHGFTETAARLDANRMFQTSRFGQFWPPAVVFACPYLVVDTPQVLVDVDFLWAYFLYLRIWTIGVLLGLLPAYVVALLVLWKSGFKHIRARYQQFAANYGVVSRYTS